jgi:Cu/Ag efflux protein CusF
MNYDYRPLAALVLAAGLAAAPAARANPAHPLAAEKPAAEAVKRHPLRGVIVEVLPDRSALLVKHEEIPGVMRAMTMLFKVDAATLAAVKKGDAITGLVSRRDGEWRLEEVQPAPAQPAK